MDSLGGRVGSGSCLTNFWTGSTGSGLTWGLEGLLPLLGLNLLGLGASTIACRDGGAGLTFSLTGSLTAGVETLVGALGMLLLFLILSPLDLDLSIVFALTGRGTSSP